MATREACSTAEGAIRVTLAPSESQYVRSSDDTEYEGQSSYTMSVR